MDEKYFTDAENEALRAIIDKLRVPPKDNFFDYYNEDVNISKEVSTNEKNI